MSLLDASRRLDGVGLPDLAHAARHAAAPRARPRILLLATEAGLLQRTAHALGQTPFDASWEPVLVGSALPDRDALLTADLVLWLTPVTAPLAASERSALEALTGLPLPHDRFLLIADTALLSRLTDEPATELALVLRRLIGLAPPGWALLVQDDLVATLQARGADLVARRQAEVEGWLTEQARARLRDRLDDLTDRAERLQAEASAQQAEDDAHAEAVERSVTAWRGAARRQHEHLLVALRGLISELATDLPAQIAAVPDRAAARQALPRWLADVVSGWLDEALEEANARLAEDLAGRPGLEALDAVSLIAPHVHPEQVPRATDRRAHLGARTALGGGLALFWAGLWAPGLLALAGGFAWASALERTDAHPEVESLVRHGREALRSLGQELEHAMEAQRDHLERQLHELSRVRLQERAAAASLRGPSHQADLAAVRSQLAGIRQHLQDLEPRSEA
jgi:hypothetical protein